MSNDCLSVAGAGEPGDRSKCDGQSALFNEPCGLCVVPGDQPCLLIADTNNHCIKRMDLNSGLVSELELVWSKSSSSTSETLREISQSEDCDHHQALPGVEVSTESVINLQVNIMLSGHDVNLTEGAPSFVEITLPPNFPFKCSTELTMPFTDFGAQPVFRLLPIKDGENPTPTEYVIRFSPSIYLCKKQDGVCFLRNVPLSLPLHVNPVPNELPLDVTIQVTHTIHA
jgi:hypothetical protein